MSRDDRIAISITDQNLQELGCKYFFHTSTYSTVFRFQFIIKKPNCICESLAPECDLWYLSSILCKNKV
jgi:hypothetical protein